MKQYLIAGTLLFLGITVRAQEKKLFTASDYDRAVSMMSGGPAAKAYAKQNIMPQWLPDGKLWFKEPESGKYIVMDPAVKGGSRTTTDKAPSEEKNLGRRRAAAAFAVSPDGRKAVYIKDWNLWVKDITTGTEKQLTRDGMENFGYATDNAGWKHSESPIVLWSPDSKKVATYQQDDRHLHDMYLVRTKVGAPELEKWKYPLPGDSSIAKIHRVIIDVETAATVRLKMAADEHRGTLSDDIAVDGSLGDNQWGGNSKQLAFVSVSRDHKVATFRVADAASGEVRTVMEEKVATQYESGQGKINWQFMPETNELIWYSERDGWGHLYLYDLTSGKLKNQITKGDFVVTQMLRADGKTRKIIFEAKGKEPGENPYYSHFYKISFDGKGLQNLTPEPGNHRASFSPDGNYFVDNYSTPTVPPVIKLKNTAGNTLGELGSIKPETLKAAGWVAPELFSVKSANNQFDLYGLLYKPSRLDVSKNIPLSFIFIPAPRAEVWVTGPLTWRAAISRHWLNWDSLWYVWREAVIPIVPKRFMTSATAIWPRIPCTTRLQG